MKNFSVFGTLVLILALIGAIIGWIIVFNRFDYVWFNFTAVFILCAITFTLGICVVISAALNGAWRRN